MATAPSGAAEAEADAEADAAEVVKPRPDIMALAWLGATVVVLANELAWSAPAGGMPMLLMLGMLMLMGGFELEPEPEP